MLWQDVMLCVCGFCLYSTAVHVVFPLDTSRVHDTILRKPQKGVPWLEGMTLLEACPSVILFPPSSKCSAPEGYLDYQHWLGKGLERCAPES